ncbi:MAG: DUF2911 domain-containing protein [Planctomycetes bacterium]|nr:DUF2911 domain-containing protein [Planctomycetota bacterium]
MKILCLNILLACSLALPAAAQQMGSINRETPTVESSIEFAGGAKVELSYRALSFGEGQFMKRVKESEQFRNMVTQNAKANPVGTLKLPATMMIGGQEVAAGEYGIHFIPTDTGDWTLTFSHKQEGELHLIQWPLALQQVETARQRLAMVLLAGDEKGSAILHLHFGNMAVDIDVLTPKKG